MMKVNENDLFYICSLIESVSRKSGNSKADIVDTLGEKKLRRLYRFANINHCLPIEQVTQEVIKDNQIVCQEKISQSRKQSVWDSGHIYQRLIVDTMNGNDWLSKMKEIYHSWICKYLDNDKKPIYWQPRSYIRECYLQQKIL